MSRAKRGFCFFLVLILIPCASLGSDITSVCQSLLSPAASGAAEISLSLKEYVPFGAERLEMLNDLLKHISFQIREKEKESSVSVLVDREEVFGLHQWTENEGECFAFSFEPETAYAGNGIGELTGAASVQAAMFSFELPPFMTADKLQWAEAAYAALEKLPELFPEYARVQEVKTRLKDLGLSVKKTTVTVPQDAVREDVMKRLGEIDAPESLRSFLLSLSFSGRQQVILYYDENGALLKANYSGQVGSPEDMRKTKLEWKGLRGSEVMDALTVNAPPAAGRNKDILTMKRTIRKSDTEEALQAELAWTMTRDGVKTVVDGSADLFLKNEGNALNGNVTLVKKTGEQESGFVAEPDLSMVPETGWSGTVRVSYLSGKNTVVGADVKLSFFPETETGISKPENITDPGSMSEEEQSALKNRIQRELASRLLKALIRLPGKDLRFLSYEMSDELWQQVLQKAIPSSEGGLD